ncbi:MAG: TadG family pilus assembly protein [Planctomycetaceae bacterium]
MRSSLYNTDIFNDPSDALSPFVLMRRTQAARKRRGAALVLGLFMIVSLVTLLAVTLDFAHIHVAETELQRAADASAMAACWEMFDQTVVGGSSGAIRVATKQAANAVAYSNQVVSESPRFAEDDVQLGVYGLDGSWTNSDTSARNAVRVTLRRQASVNGELPLFFGAITGRDSLRLQTTATAAMYRSISGFYEPEDSDDKLDILPLALDLPSWLDAVAGATTDNYAFAGGGVQAGSDGVFETNLYPKGVGAPGNRGTVDIGGANNSTADLSRQISQGISKQDFIDLGKPLQFDANGELELNGDTGISAGIKDELADLIGKVRIIPIYTRVSGNGNNAMFTIVRWEGVRILDVKLTGSKDSKKVMIQPAKVIARGAKIDHSGAYASTHVYTPVMLVE